MDTVVQREGGMNWEIRIDIEIANVQHKELSSVLCDDLEGCEVCPRWRGHIYTYRDSFVHQKLM